MIVEILKTDLKSYPNSSSKRMPDPESGACKVYQCKLPEKELGLFDLLEVFVFEDGLRNYSFKTSNSSIKKDASLAIDLCKLLYTKLGTDDIGGKEMDDYDIECIKTDTFWGGRIYMEEKFKIPVTYSYDDQGGLNLCFYDVVV